MRPTFIPRGKPIQHNLLDVLRHGFCELLSTNVRHCSQSQTLEMLFVWQTTAVLESVSLVLGNILETKSDLMEFVIKVSNSWFSFSSNVQARYP